MLTIVVDYSRIGRSSRFTTRLLAEERQLLHTGDIVAVTGDDVDERYAKVVSIRDGSRMAEFEFCPQP